MEEKTNYQDPIDEVCGLQPEPEQPQSRHEEFSEPKEDVFERFADKIATCIAQAEERGYRRAIEAMKEAERKAVEHDRSVPNFLSDIRPDIWEN